MPGRVEGKTAVVTGAGSGIGQAVAVRLAQEGARVAVLDICEERAEQTVGLIREKGGEAMTVLCDVTDAGAWQKAAEDIVKAYGRIDIAVNNTGIFRDGDVLSANLEDYDAMMGVNTKGVFIGIKTVAPIMIGNGGGSIINIASEAGIAAIPGQVIYNTSKAAVIMMTKSCAVDLALKNVRVNCVCPGRVHTALVQRILDEAEDYDTQYRIMSEDRPVKHMGKPEDIAAGVLFFASD